MSNVVESTGSYPPNRKGGEIIEEKISAYRRQTKSLLGYQNLTAKNFHMFNVHGLNMC